MISNCWPFLLNLARAGRTELAQIIPPSNLVRSRFFLICWQQALSASTQTTSSAPLLSASRPMAPLPAYRSRNELPGIFQSMILNNASFTRSLVGRVARLLTLASLVPFAFPAITLMAALLYGVVIQFLR